MGNNELNRGKNDGIILFILSKGARHTDELKEIIDTNFSAVKLGTLYSIITRLKTSNYISEYRASSLDGSRRKYYKLTKKGEDFFANNFADTFLDVKLNLSTSFEPQNQAPIEKPTVIIENTQELEEIEVQNESTIIEPTIVEEETSAPTYIENSENSSYDAQNYSDIINESVLNTETIDDIDFSSLKVEPEDSSAATESKVFNENEYVYSTEIELKNTYVPYSQDTSVNEQVEINYDSPINSKYEYEKVLNKLFPKQRIVVEDFEEKIEEPIINEENKQADWTEIYNLAEKDGIKVRTSSDTNRYQGSKTFVTRLLLTSSFITLALAILEYLLLTTLFSTVGFDKRLFLRILVIFGIPVLATLFAFLINPSAKVKTLPKFIDMIEIALIIAIATIIITFAISAIIGINYTNVVETFNMLVIPSVLVLNVPIFTIITYLLTKVDFFETL